eukprot:m.181205 g.181205  ORF g.181205 m.181205 type:complete len:63 (+) comp32055_c0_seq5:2780-2968(+)
MVSRTTIMRLRLIRYGGDGDEYHQQGMHTIYKPHDEWPTERVGHGIGPTAAIGYEIGRLSLS